MKDKDVIEKFISRFQAKVNAKADEYKLMETAHYTWILSPVRKGERTVVWHLER